MLIRLLTLLLIVKSIFAEGKPDAGLDVPFIMPKWIPEIEFSRNNTFYFSHNETEINMNDLEIGEIKASDFKKEECRVTRFSMDPKYLNYFFFNLGQVNSTWNLDMKEDFTRKIDISLKCPGLIGYVIESPTDPIHFGTLPILKIAYKDLRRHMRLNQGNIKPVGLKLKDTHIDPDEEHWLKFYFGENSTVPMQFYQFGEDYEKQIDVPIYDCFKKQPPLLRNMTKPFPVDVSNKAILGGIDLSLFPHSPREERCDCVMNGLVCYAGCESTPLGEKNEKILQQVCDYVHCKTIMNDVDRGIYGLFAGCHDYQRLSIALNLYCSLQRSTNQDIHKFNGLLKARESPVNFKSAKEVTAPPEYYAFRPKCGDFIPGDWEDYLVGKRTSNLSAADFQSDYSDDDILDEEYSSLAKKNLALKKQPIPNTFLVIFEIIIILYVLF